ncbi:ATP-binding cassette domain-containing protein [Alkalicoccus urumqiensis]|uniref:ABC transporter n=1 Tax=Alkalicoccus urumqiensis TaxID=1548213 RepID=A0A2P6MDZ3_ALKUR|nr:ABC transporter ATP-binding protein [Alkalicoccus urumqiensis]PRO64503.1 ABC transporter [Alkalicoccus urumqiensis]
MSHIQADHLSAAYKKERVLHDVTFTLSGERIYGLIGRNGAGKTTLLSLLASYRRPDGGTLLMDGTDPFEDASCMASTVFMYEKDYSDEQDSARVLLKLAARYRPAFDLDYALSLAETFDFPLDKPMHKLSTGKQAAVNVTLGLAARAPLTIFDEIYTGMDAPTRDQFYKELLAEQERHPRTVILSTHLVSEMDYLFDEVLMIDDGQLLLHEPTDQLLERGFSVTGPAGAVEQFAEGRRVLSEQTLGGVKSVTIFEELTAKDTAAAYENGLEIGPVGLQDLFIQLTGKGAGVS